MLFQTKTILALLSQPHTQRLCSERYVPSILVLGPLSSPSVTICRWIFPSLYASIVGVFLSGYPSMHKSARISQNFISPYLDASSRQMSLRTRDSRLVLADDVRFTNTKYFNEASVTSLA